MRDFAAKTEGLERVLDRWRASAGVRAEVNWTALEAAGVDRPTPVTVDEMGASWLGILEAILREAGGETLILSHTVMEDGVVVISTWENLHSERSHVTRVYDVGFWFKGVDAQKREESAARLVSRVKAVAVRELARRFKDYEWVGTIREENGKLTVRETADVQREIGDLIERLRVEGGK
jgi:hypothetical protein